MNAIYDSSLTFSGAEKEAKRHPPNPSPSLYGRGVTDYGGKPPYVRVLVWLTKPVPLRGEPWSFNLIKDRTL